MANGTPRAVQCPKGHIRATRSAFFNCHGKRFETAKHLASDAAQKNVKKAVRRGAPLAVAAAAATPQGRAALVAANTPQGKAALVAAGALANKTGVTADIKRKFKFSTEDDDE